MAAALATSPVGSTPARALGGEDAIGILLGLGALYAIGKAIEDDKDKSKSEVRRDRTSRQVYTPPAYRRDEWRNRDRAGHGHRYQKSVPGECLRSYFTRNGPVRGFSKPCLEQTLRRPARLPEQCALVVRTDRGPRTIYAPRCLRRDGWRVAAWDDERWRRSRWHD